MNRNFIKGFSFLCLLAVLVSANCLRGGSSDKPPVHLVPDMDYQKKYQPQEESPLFADRSSSRTPVEGTVALDGLYENTPYYQGRDKDGKFVKVIPVPVDIQFLERGRERFDIYCSVCHSKVGDGKGILFYKGFGPPANFHVDSLQTVEDGYIFDVITNGKGNMPSLSHQIPVKDRWYITGYVRALQRSRNARLSDIPPAAHLKKQ